VYHNTVIQNGTYPVAIEYRFSSTTAVEVINNLTDAAIVARDGAQGQVIANVTTATPGMFVNAAAANLHLTATATRAIDQGVSVAGVTVDIDGEPRPAGGAPDLGADEVTPAQPVNQPPVASMTASPLRGDAPLVVAFDGRASSDPEGQTLLYEWSFGDGQFSEGSTISHVYSSAGSYTATLRVSDPTGLFSTSGVVIIVNQPASPPPPASLVAPANLTGVQSGQDVRLTWADRASGETQYEVERATGTGKKTTFTVVARLGADATTYVDPAVARNTYRYRVRAVIVATGQVSPYSNTAEVRVR
jgi:PKD repeat protein